MHVILYCLTNILSSHNNAFLLNPLEFTFGAEMLRPYLNLDKHFGLFNFIDITFYRGLTVKKLVLCLNIYRFSNPKMMVLQLLSILYRDSL